MGETIVKKSEEKIVENSKVSKTQENIGELRKEGLGRQNGAKKILSMCRTKLKNIDDEEELFRSVLITNTLKTVKKEISTKKKKGIKKKGNKIVRQLHNQLAKFGAFKMKVWKYKMRRLMKRKQARMLSQKL